MAEWRNGGLAEWGNGGMGNGGMVVRSSIPPFLHSAIV
jgi:hypothetical protein